MILALDIGSKLGYYKEGEDSAVTVDLGKGDDRFLEFIIIIQHLNKDEDVTEVVYEDAKFQRGHAIPIYHGMIGLLKAYCTLNGLPCTGIAVGTIKKYFTGKGNCGKDEVMKRCDELKMKYDDDNSADAYAVYYTHKEL